jgi:hypothetical protein
LRRGDAPPCVGDHRGEELETDRVVVVAEKAADVEMLFDPAKLSWTPKMRQVAKVEPCP